jgi:hypothetical protein
VHLQFAPVILYHALALAAIVLVARALLGWAMSH